MKLGITKIRTTVTPKTTFSSQMTTKKNFYIKSHNKVRIIINNNNNKVKMNPPILSISKKKNSNLSNSHTTVKNQNKLIHTEHHWINLLDRRRPTNLQSTYQQQQLQLQLQQQHHVHADMSKRKTRNQLKNIKLQFFLKQFIIR
jgi:septum formation inhibitor MinC